MPLPPLVSAALMMILPLAGLLVAELRAERAIEAARRTHDVEASAEARAEGRGWLLVCKPLASLVFLIAGARVLNLDDKPALLVFLGLLLSFLGDVLLIPKGKKLTFLLGLAAFLCAHVTYGAAFVAHGVDARATAIGGVALVVLGAPIAQWLLPKVHGTMRPPVLAYVVTITAMVALAIGAFGQGARLTLPIGAFVFYLSDICVARERFVSRSMWNGMIGLPLYYAAQLLLIDGICPA